MSDCCSMTCASDVFPRRHTCPVNGNAYGRVSPVTMKHHIRAPWAWREQHQGYYFCTDPDCRVVYFGEDGSIIDRAALRADVGVKQKSDNALVCYCYSISRREAALDPRIREFVVEETRQQRCACEYRNPSGRCCLADFPKP